MVGGRATEPISTQGVRAATRGTYVAFIGAGFATASWASRIPQIRDHLGLEPSQLGLVLLSIAAGSLVALPLSGVVVGRLGSRRTVTLMVFLLALGLGVVAGGYLVGLVPVVIGLFVVGLANGAWDVAMNVQGAIVEQHLGKSIMSRFHAGYSLGTVLGALIGVAMVAAGVPVAAHLAAAGAVLAILVPVHVRSFVPDHEVVTTPTVTSDGADASSTVHVAAPRRSVLASWREPHVLLTGLFVLSFAFAEGTGNDWISVAVIDGYGAPATLGTLAFATFLAAMTAGRWFGPTLLDRFGRVAVVRALAAVGGAGVLVFVFGPNTPTAFIGTLLWGVGVSLGFPVGMSAAADDPKLAASRVSVVASIGYCAFLGGPPLIGFLGDHVTVLRAVSAVAALLALAFMIAPTVRPLSRGDNRRDDDDDNSLGQPGS